MYSMNAKQDWVAYGQALQKKEIDKDLNFGMIEMKIPIFTDTTGIYLSMEYMFSDDSLLQLEQILENAYMNQTK